jgi:hypothetical protein
MNSSGSTVRVSVVREAPEDNPGDGLLVLNAIREIQKIEEFCDLNYGVAFYADQRYEIMGSAFDEMTEGATLADGSPPDVDEELLQPNKNPLFPKLTFSKHKITESDWRSADLREAHVTILIDRFSTKVLTRHTAIRNRHQEATACTTYSPSIVLTSTSKVSQLSVIRRSFDGKTLGAAGVTFPRVSPSPAYGCLRNRR